MAVVLLVLFFNRTVVLICQHSTDGAFGLVLNRGAERTVGEAITDELPERIGDQDLWVGGPVQPAAHELFTQRRIFAECECVPEP